VLARQPAGVVSRGRGRGRGGGRAGRRGGDIEGDFVDIDAGLARLGTSSQK
jgi:hypothetical protein